MYEGIKSARKNVNGLKDTNEKKNANTLGSSLRRACIRFYAKNTPNRAFCGKQRVESGPVNREITKV